MHSNAGAKYFDMLSEVCLIPGNLFQPLGSSPFKVYSFYK